VQAAVRSRATLSLLAVAGPLALFAGLAARVWSGGDLGWDDPVADLVADVVPVSSAEVHVDPYVNGTTIVVTALVAVGALRLLMRRQLRAAIFPVSAIGGAVLLSSLVKAIVQRPAIEGGEGDYSFPSGTATWSMATAAAVVLLARSSRLRWRLLLAGSLLVLGTAVVIIWEEWHYPSDVLAGWCLAIGWVTALWLVLLRPRWSGGPQGSS
jgi:membrane-associated phospholipid phosphatase